MKHTMKALGLPLLAAIGMMATTAVVAQAEEMKEGSLRVEGKILTFGEEAEFAATTSTPGKLVVPKLKIKIKCEETLASGSFGNYIFNALGQKELGLHFHGKILKLLHKCTVEEGGANCTIYPTRADLQAGTNAGSIHTSLSALWLTRLAGGIGHIRLEGANGLGNGLRANTIAVWYYSGAKCTLPEETETNGVFALMIPNAATESKEHTIEDISLAEETALKTAGMTDIGLFYGKEPAEIEGGRVTGGLVGALLGLNFSGA